MTVTLHLPPETERILKEKVAQSGQTLAAYLEEIVQAHLEGANQAASGPTPDNGDETPAPPEGEGWPQVVVPPPEGETIFTQPATFPLEGLPRCELDVTIDPHWLEEDDE